VIFVFEKLSRESTARFYFKTGRFRFCLKNKMWQGQVFLTKFLIFAPFMAPTSDLIRLIKTPHNTVIVSHRNPDGDAIGSSLAMRHYLEQHGHNVHVVLPSEYPEEFTILPGIGDILIWDIHEEQIKEILTAKNLVIFLDFNALSRIDKLGEALMALDAQRIMIDHHLYPDPIAQHVISDTTASSTCEMVYDFMDQMQDLQRLTPKVGDCILTGIITDTGGFRFSTSAKLFRLVANLCDRGVDTSYLMDQIFNSQKEKHLRLLGHCLANRMEVIPEYHTAIIALTQKDYEDFDIQRGDSEGIVNYLLSMRHVKLAAFIHNQPSVVKISMRSKGDINVQEICRKYFNGGGHKNASGAHSYASLQATIAKFKSILPEYKDQLQA
jgi:bifunctional oligoribonuclease and PAP phosphatase NrnA